MKHAKSDLRKRIKVELQIYLYLMKLFKYKNDILELLKKYCNIPK